MLRVPVPQLRRMPAAVRSPWKLSRPLSTSVQLPRASLPRSAFVASTLRGQVLARGVASAVSGKPGSQSLGQAALNIKEEVGNSASDFAKTIAGANVYADSVVSPQRTFLGITNAVAQSVPTPYMILGLSGGLPYLGLSAASVYLAHQAGLAIEGVGIHIDPGVAITMLHQALDLQVTYGAVLLSFVGALHWGMEFAGYGGHKGYTRLMLGTMPMVLGWSTLALPPMEALIAQWATFTGVWWMDLRATMAGWTPKWYSQYRFYLSILVGTCIITTLAATSYWGPVGGHGLVNHDLQMIRAERKSLSLEKEGRVGGDVETVTSRPQGDHYVVVKKKATPEDQ